MKRPLKAIIEDVIIQPSKIQPIIVNFLNGELKDEEAENMSCGMFYDKKKQRTLLALSNGQIVYKGYRPDVSKELTRTMLVFHNKRTGKVKLVQAERWQVGPVLHKPLVHNNDYAKSDKFAMLNKQFGSKKIKRQTEQFERMKVDVDAVKDHLEKTVSNVEIDRADLSVKSTDEHVIDIHVPKCNRRATCVNEVYNVYDIIPQNKLETLYETAERILREGTDRKSRFFMHTLNQLKTDPDNIKKVALLLYIEAVGNWFKMRLRDMKSKGPEICPYSREIYSHIVDAYSNANLNGRTRPSNIKDKGIIHSMILALTICNFTLDLELFLTTVARNVGLKKLHHIARILLALPNKTNKNLVTLKLPLPSQLQLMKIAQKKK